MIDFEIKKVKPDAVKPIHSEEVEKERYKDIKSRLGRSAVIETFGEKRRINKVTQGIQRSKGALKWMADTLKEE